MPQLRRGRQKDKRQGHAHRYASHIRLRRACPRVLPMPHPLVALLPHTPQVGDVCAEAGYAPRRTHTPALGRVHTRPRLPLRLRRRRPGKNPTGLDPCRKCWNTDGTACLSLRRLAVVRTAPATQDIDTRYPITLLLVAHSSEVFRA